MKALKVGKAEVVVEFERWIKHGRSNILVLILNKASPFSDYDSLRNTSDESEIRDALDWMIENEDVQDFVGYTNAQVKALSEVISKKINE